MAKVEQCFLLTLTRMEAEILYCAVNEIMEQELNLEYEEGSMELQTRVLENIRALLPIPL